MVVGVCVILLLPNTSQKPHGILQRQFDSVRYMAFLLTMASGLTFSSTVSPLDGHSRRPGFDPQLRRILVCYMWCLH